MIAAMRNLGFDNYIAPLELYLARYNEVCGNVELNKL
jgi:hypothetical protein